MGDRIRADAHPDPQKALVYGVGTMHNLSLEPFERRGGLITDVNPTARTLGIQFGRKKLVADISDGTNFRFPNRKRASFTDVTLGDTVELSGIENSRLQEITSTTNVIIRQQPRARGTPVP